MKWTHAIQTGFDIRRQARELNVPLWQTPSVLFSFLGGVILALMAVVYVSSKNSDDPGILIVSEVIVVALSFTVGGFVIRSLEQMARTNKMKTDFISIVSHQLRGPLSQMRWRIESLHNNAQGGMSAEVSNDIQDLSNTNAAMIRLVGDLLDVARVESGEVIVRAEAVRIDTVVRSVCDALGAEAKRKHISFSVHIPEKIPSVACDRARLQAAVDNIVSNAIRYTKSGGSVEVSISVVQSDGIVCISVKDTGIGISKSDKDRIFEKFFRAENGKVLEANGTGMGLYLAKMIAQQSGGELAFSSIENVGSEFALTLPFGSDEHKISL